MNHTRYRKLGALLLAVVLLAAGCGDDDEEGGNGGGNGGGGGGNGDGDGGPEGEPIVVAVIVPVDAPEARFPEVVAAVEAGAMGINERGGIQGRPVEVFFCDESQDTAAAEQCANEAVERGAVASIGQFSRGSGPQIYAVLEENNIPSLGPTAINTADFSSPVSYPIDGGIVAYGIGCGALFGEAAGIQNISTALFAVDEARRFGAAVQIGVSSAGSTFSGAVEIPPEPVPQDPFVQQAADNNAEGIALILTEQGSVAFMETAAGLGQDFAYCHGDGAVTDQNLAGLGPDLRYYASAPNPAVNAQSDDPDIQRFYEELGAAREAGVENAGEELVKGSSARAWQAMQVFEEVANSIEGEINGESLITQLDETTDAPGGLLFADTIDFTTLADLQEGMPRIANPLVTLLEWNAEEARFVNIDGVDTVDVLEILPG